ncbi:MAG: hypothetical protein EYC68_06840 [Chloroflexota bacterium]|nr:MAG: hypothetical protein EYC68_06840 [Chloroflexota bacterium]
MSQIEFYIRVVKALDEIAAPYMIVGAFAGLSFGITRSTYDVDLIVDLKSYHADLLSARFPLPRYYADPDMIRDSMQQKVMFNLIDTKEGAKADMVPLSREPEYRLAFSRRIRRLVNDGAGNTFEAWIAQPTDIIIGKLEAWTEGRSTKHSADILQMLVFDFGGFSTHQIDLDHVTRQATRLDIDTLTLWQDLVERAKRDVQKR